MSLKFHNRVHDPKEQQNEIYTIVKGGETFYGRHKSLSPAVVKSNMLLKRLSLGSYEYMCFQQLTHTYYTVIWN